MTIKICGITRRADAEAAVALGVHAVGFILWPSSPRGTTVENAAGIIRRLPPFVTPVGVFVDPTPEEIARAQELGGIRVAQVHGSVRPGGGPEDLGGGSDLRGGSEDPLYGLPKGLTLLQAVHLAGHGGRVMPEVADGAPVLLDSFDPLARGGTGRTVNWTEAAAVARSRPVILAGGLTPDNVAEAIRIVHPYGVDVSSGIERSPGIKDPDKLAAFVAAVKAA